MSLDSLGIVIIGIPLTSWNCGRPFLFKSIFLPSKANNKGVTIAPIYQKDIADYLGCSNNTVANYVKKNANYKYLRDFNLVIKAKSNYIQHALNALNTKKKVIFRSDIQKDLKHFIRFYVL